MQAIEYVSAQYDVPLDPDYKTPKMKRGYVGDVVEHSFESLTKQLRKEPQAHRASLTEKLNSAITQVSSDLQKSSKQSKFNLSAMIMSFWS